MKIVLAIDSFKGCLSSEEAEAAARLGIKRFDETAEVVTIPLSDGGDGMLAAFGKALNAEVVNTEVHDALMRPVRASYGIAPDGTAIIETAQACGLMHILPQERDVMRATTYGVGELFNDAYRKGCRKFIVGLGGSATSDCGMGMLSALNNDYFLSGKDCSFMLACDVHNPLYGTDGAAAVFGPQKGATAEQVKWLDKQARQFAIDSAKLLGRDCSMQAGAGAAGGLGYAFMQYLEGKMVSGAELLLHFIAFDDMIKQADLIITGEGSADEQTLMGKLPSVVLRHAALQNVPVWLIAGAVRDRKDLLHSGFEKVESIHTKQLTLSEMLQPEVAKRNIADTVCRLLKNYS